MSGKVKDFEQKYGDKIKSLKGKQAQDFPDYCSYIEFIFSDIRYSDSLIVVMDQKPEESLIFHKKSLWEN